MSIFQFSGKAFNADDRAAQLNAGSYQHIPLAVRTIVNREFEAFVHSNIRDGTDFALETTLRSTITFDQARLARANGFQVSMVYVALDTVERHIERVIRRASRGGHSASETTLRRIHASSLANLPMALAPDRSGIQSLFVFDNSRPEGLGTPALEAMDGRIVWLATDFPEWLRVALGWTLEDLNLHRSAAKSG